MKTFELSFPKNCPEKKLISLFEKTILSCDLTFVSQGSLKTLPGSVHWHMQKETEDGTLEATLLYAERRIYLSYHDNRFAEWIPSAIERITTSWRKAKCG